MAPANVLGEISSNGPPPRNSDDDASAAKAATGTISSTKFRS
jgi:hypothetical protein